MVAAEIESPPAEPGPETGAAGTCHTATAVTVTAEATAETARPRPHARAAGTCHTATAVAVAAEPRPTAMNARTHGHLHPVAQAQPRRSESLHGVTGQCRGRRHHLGLRRCGKTAHQQRQHQQSAQLLSLHHCIPPVKGKKTRKNQIQAIFPAPAANHSMPRQTATGLTSKPVQETLRLRRFMSLLPQETEIPPKMFPAHDPSRQGHIPAKEQAIVAQRLLNEA